MGIAQFSNSSLLNIYAFKITLLLMVTNIWFYDRNSAVKDILIIHLNVLSRIIVFGINS